MRIGIIGAGIAGLTLARRLVDAGHSALLVDRGRGVGGRATTRRLDGATFDHGAQYFTARDPKFRDFLDARVTAGAWAEWRGRFATLEGGRLVAEAPRSPRHVGVPGMGSLARAMAEGLEIRRESRVFRLEGGPGRWIMVDSSGHAEGPFDRVASAAPPAQAVALLGEASPIIAEGAGRVAMQPCFALLLTPPGGASLPFDGIRCRHPVLAWVANDQSKPGRGPGPALVIHSDQDWAAAHLLDDPEEVARMLAEAATEAFGVDLGPAGPDEVHRWFYAKPAEPLGRPCLVDEAAGLSACGDWCIEAKVEGAFLSGDACADAILG